MWPNKNELRGKKAIHREKAEKVVLLNSPRRREKAVKERYSCIYLLFISLTCYTLWACWVHLSLTFALIYYRQFFEMGHIPIIVSRK